MKCHGGYVDSVSHAYLHICVHACCDYVPIWCNYMYTNLMCHGRYSLPLAFGVLAFGV